ncbi:unnamed protein product [Alternaria alternata]
MVHILKRMRKLHEASKGTCNRPPTGTSESFAGEGDRTGYALNSTEDIEGQVQKTGAQQLEPTEQELAEMKEIEEFKERSEADRVQVRERLLKERREAELLKLARGEVPATN